MLQLALKFLFSVKENTDIEEVEHTEAGEELPVQDESMIDGRLTACTFSALPRSVC